MRVLFTYSAVGVGGDAIQTLALVAALRAGGHQVELVGPNPVRPYDFVSPMFGVPNFAYHFIPRPFLEFVIEFCLQFVTLYRARALIRTQKFDLVFHRGHIYDLVGVPIAQMARCPLVVLLDAPHGEEWDMIGKSYNRRLNHFAMERLTRQATLITTISQFSREYFLGLGVPPEKVLVQPNGVSHAQLQRGLIASREFSPFRSQDTAVVGFVGNFTPWHRVDLLLDAIKRLQLRGSVHFKAVIVGNGSTLRECRSLAERLELNPYVNWVGEVPHAEAFRRIEEFDVAILPNTLCTGSPLKLLEYAALARPIMAPDLPNIRDIFEHGKDIWLFEPGNPTALADGLETLRLQPEFARELGRNALEKMRNHTWEENVSRILEALS